MTSRLSGHFSIFGLVLFVLSSLLGIARQYSGKKFASFFTLKPRSHVVILINRTSAIVSGINAGDAPVSFWLFFFSHVPVTVPEVFMNVNWFHKGQH